MYSFICVCIHKRKITLIDWLCWPFLLRLHYLDGCLFYGVCLSKKFGEWFDIKAHIIHTVVDINFLYNLFDLGVVCFSCSCCWFHLFLFSFPFRWWCPSVRCCLRPVESHALLFSAAVVRQLNTFSYVYVLFRFVLYFSCWFFFLAHFNFLFFFLVCVRDGFCCSLPLFTSFICLEFCALFSFLPSFYSLFGVNVMFHFLVIMSMRFSPVLVTLSHSFTVFLHVCLPFLYMFLCTFDQKTTQQISKERKRARKKNTRETQKSNDQ